LAPPDAYSSPCLPSRQESSIGHPPQNRGDARFSALLTPHILPLKIRRRQYVAVRWFHFSSIVRTALPPVDARFFVVLLRSRAPREV
jgi:hypothetical protein